MYLDALPLDPSDLFELPARSKGSAEPYPQEPRPWGLDAGLFWASDLFPAFPRAKAEREQRQLELLTHDVTCHISGPPLGQHDADVLLGCVLACPCPDQATPFTMAELLHRLHRPVSAASMAWLTKSLWRLSHIHLQVRTAQLHWSVPLWTFLAFEAESERWWMRPSRQVWELLRPDGVMQHIWQVRQRLGGNALTKWLIAFLWILHGESCRLELATLRRLSGHGAGSRQDFHSRLLFSCAALVKAGLVGQARLLAPSGAVILRHLPRPGTACPLIW